VVLQRLISWMTRHFCFAQWALWEIAQIRHSGSKPL
jgi:hypothetical protein